jgi:hypothetical protein
MRTNQRPAAGGVSSTGGAKILAFKRRGPGGRATLPRISDPLTRIEAEEDRRRMRENVAAVLIIALLFGAGYLLINELRTSARIAICLEAGHRNCAPLDLQSIQGH